MFFAKGIKDDELINEQIRSFTVNDSLFETFIRDDKGYFFNNGFVAPRVQLMKESNQYIEEWIHKNIREFWKDKKHLAEEYLKEYKIYIESQDVDYMPEFSEEFMVETIKLFITKLEWFNEFTIIELDRSLDFHLLYRT